MTEHHRVEDEYHVCKHEATIAVLAAAQVSIERKLDLLLLNAATDAREANIRIRGLEDWRNRQAGALALASLVAGAIGSVVVICINWLLKER